MGVTKVLVVTETTVKEFLANVPEDKNFWVSGGRTLRNLADLQSALKQMSDETYSYHVNEEKCDFSTWVRDVVGDGELADDLENATTRAQAAKFVVNRIAQFKSQKSMR